LTAPASFTPIGYVQCARSEPIDDDWDSLPATIELDASSFSHVEVIYLFHEVPDGDVNLGARHPRGREDWPKIGIFAQRGKDRPNRIGATICRVVSVQGRVLKVSGLDAIDRSPVLDLKPVMSGFQPRGDFREPDWARELMEGYW
jgi:tRNA (Thr-GGU) A37 N-methylase